MAWWIYRHAEGSQSEPIDVEMGDHLEEIICDLGQESFLQAHAPTYDTLKNNSKKHLYSGCKKSLMLLSVVWFHNCSVLGLLMFVFILFQQGSWNQQWRCFRVYFDFSFRSFHLLLFDVRFWGLISPMLCVMVGDIGFFFWMRKLKPTIKVHSSLFVFFFH